MDEGRYVVCGMAGDIQAWRRSRNLRPQDIIAVSTTNASAMRGMSGPFTVVTLESWAAASPRVRATFELDLALAQAARART